MLKQRLYSLRRWKLPQLLPELKITRARLGVTGTTRINLTLTHIQDHSAHCAVSLNGLRADYRSPYRIVGFVLAGVGYESRAERE